MLSTPGIGSGLDISGIIDQLMTLERRPLVALGTDQVELEAQLSGFGKLKSTISLFRSAVSDLSSTDKFEYYKAISSDDEVLTANADSNAAKGVFSIDVQRLAENHRQAATTVFADPATTTIGTAGDTMTLTVGTDAFTVEIGDKTLAGVRDAINAASDNTGVTASILQDDTGYHLTLSADDTGSDNLITVSYSAADPFAMQDLNQDRDGSGTFTASDLDAVLTLENTFTVTRTTNTVSDAIEGVTLNLEKAGITTVEIDRDDDKIRGSVQQFIGVYNEVVNIIDELRGNVLSEERSSLASLESQFRNLLNTEAGTSSKFSYLFELGVSTRLNGTLELDSSVFDSALDADPQGVASLFADADSGLATRFDAFASSLIDAGGLFDSREQSLNAQIRRIESDRARVEFRLIQREQSLVQQFSALDSLIANLNTTSSFLGQQLDALAAQTRSSNGG